MQAPLPHLPQEFHGTLPLTTLLTSADGSAVADDVGSHPPHPHVLQEIQGAQPITTLATGTDGGIVANDVGFQTAPPHGTEEVERRLPLTPLLAGTDSGAVTDDLDEKTVTGTREGAQDSKKEPIRRWSMDQRQKQKTTDMPRTENQRDKCTTRFLLLSFQFVRTYAMASQVAGCSWLSNIATKSIILTVPERVQNCGQ